MIDCTQLQVLAKCSSTTACIEEWAKQIFCEQKQGKSSCKRPSRGQLQEAKAFLGAKVLFTLDHFRFLELLPAWPPA